jgi:Fe-S oxidoreductase
MWLLRAWLDGQIRTSARLGEILYSCATCANCTEHCVFPKFREDLLHAFLAARESLVSEGIVPPGVRDYLKAIQVHGNPYRLPQADRGKWANGLGLDPYDGQEYLFYTGCVGAYDERGRRMARSVAGLLKDWGVSFGILGSEEHCDGNEVRALGEIALFQELSRGNIGQFQEKGVNKIITLSPHAFHAMRNEYPALGGSFEVYHYSQILGAAAKDAQIPPKPGPLKVTFHDPCYLGRHNGEYRAPRQILRRLPGVQLVEMPRTRADALCCGGGGGNFFTDILGPGSDSPARTRVREATETQADIIVVACPNCAKMLDDAVKAESAEDHLTVMDLAEVIQLS